MKRTKTPKQVREQWQRISRYLRNRISRPDFMAYLNTYARYCNRMADYNGESPYWHNGKFYYNKRNNAPVPVEIYAAK